VHTVEQPVTAQLTVVRQRRDDGAPGGSRHLSRERTPGWDQEKPGHIRESAPGAIGARHGGALVILLFRLAILLGAQLNATIDRASQPVEPAALKVA
jgi:hypothetical protein